MSQNLKQPTLTWPLLASEGRRGFNLSRVDSLCQRRTDHAVTVKVRPVVNRLAGRRPPALGDETT